MNVIDTNNVLKNLHTLTDLETSYMEYSDHPKDYIALQTYIAFLNNRTIQSRNLSKYYFRSNIVDSSSYKYASEVGDLTDGLTIAPGYDFSICKLFNFPNSLRHKCNYFTLLYQMEGSCKVSLDSGTHEIHCGDFFIISPEVFYSLEAQQDGIAICMDIRTSFLAAEYKAVFLENPILCHFIVDSISSDHSVDYVAIHTDGNAKITELLLTIFAEYINDDEYSCKAMRSYLTLLFATVLRNPSTAFESTMKITKKAEYYQQIVNYLKKNYQHATLSTVSDSIHFSKQYICKIVRDESGETFNTLLIRIRLEMVKQYLSESNLTLEDIAYICGFSTAPHMSRVFKTNYGMSPSAFRASLR